MQYTSDGFMDENGQHYPNVEIRWFTELAKPGIPGRGDGGDL